MLIDKDSLIVNGISIGKYLTSVTFGYHKGWGEDTGRNTLSGDYSGTFLGIFPKITCTFKKLYKDEIEELTPLLDSKRQTVSYYDTTLKKTVTMATYSNDYEITNKRIIGNCKAESFQVAFISTKKRSDT